MPGRGTASRSVTNSPRDKKRKPSGELHRFLIFEAQYRTSGAFETVKIALLL
jgi:hypothetical protein